MYDDCMKDILKRFLLFLVGCIGTRLMFVVVAKKINRKYLPYLGYLALVPAVGFMYIYLTKSRTTGPEVFGEKIWWNDLRPVHSLLYFLFAYNAIQINDNSWMYLLADVLIGLFAFLGHHFFADSFSKLVDK